jgi:hypothetical protein
MKDQATVQERLFRLFTDRTPGLLGGDTILESLEIALCRPEYGFTNVVLEKARDLLNLTDEQAECSLKILPGLDCYLDPRLTLLLVAGEARR